MPVISLCMIVRDEEKCIAKCLASVKGVADEIIIVDTGSKDETKKIAAGFGANVIDFIWTGSFADARNASLEAANGDWVLFLDADEYLEPSCHGALRKNIAQADVEGYYIPVVNIYGSEQQPEQCRDILFRLFRNRSEYRFRGIIHEQVLNSILEKDSKANIAIAHDITIYHYGYLDSQVQEKDKINRNLEFLAQQIKDSPEDKYVLYQYGLELYRAERYGESIEMLKKSLAGLAPGGPESMYLPKLIRLIVMAHYQARRYEEAVEYVKYGLSIYQDYADLYHYGGLCFYELRAYGTSFEYFMKSTTLGEQSYVYGSYPGVKGFKSYFYMGKICEEFDSEEEALGYYLVAFRENPSFHIALEQMVRILVKGEESDDVRIALANMCECCTAEAKFILGRMLFIERSYKLAGEYLEAAAVGGLNTAEVNICRAICLAQQDRVIEALRILDEYVNDSEHYVRAIFNKAIILWLQDNAFKVRSITDSLIKMGLDDDFMAIVKLIRSRPNEQMDFVSLRPDSSELLFDILLRAMDHGDFKKVDDILAGMHHEWITVHAYRLMQMYLRHNRLNDAERYGHIYLVSTQESFDALVCMGVIKSKKEEYWEAAEYYRAAVTIAPCSPKAYVNLLKMYDKLCLETLKTAVKNHPDVELFKAMLEQEAARQ
ncbi:glycosyltransferase family 2 protein [Sporomusa malonica]|uniref:Glycosyl transferase family 2 n=1 Tax=Sporomusa malonica TaxID=112901 RepID=A0A1W2F4S6_9FIRM|nr:glycosyltransferase family 2 protein [Sporomusa malonica]SMD16894.1 Glycosyl transferase family 2 [Sporomusa malonica]